MSNLNGINIISVINSLTAKSPKAKVTQEIPVAKNAIEKNKNVSVIDPITDEARGAKYHIFFLKISKICTSKF